MNLDTVNKSLEIVLGGPIASAQLTWVVHYADIDQTSIGVTAITEADGLSNNTTPVTMVAAPASGKTRQITEITITNTDTVTQVVTVSINDNGIRKPVQIVGLATDSTLQFNGTWSIIPSPGGSVGPVGPQGGIIFLEDVEQGEQGERGYTGPQGIQGIQGIIGPTGNDGDDGSDSLIPGPTGPAGSSGGGSYVTLHSNSGTTQSAVAISVDTYALASQLGPNDTLVVRASVSALTAGVALSVLNNSTDSVLLANLSNGNNLTAGQLSLDTWEFRMDQSGATTVICESFGTANISVGGGFSNGSRLSQVVTFTTNFTGAWTIQFKIGAVTATGTARWAWSIAQIKG